MLDKLLTKAPFLPTNRFLHGLKDAQEMFELDPNAPWGFERDGLITEWSTTPSACRCRMRKSQCGRRVAFEVDLRADRAHTLPGDVLNVYIYPTHIDSHTHNTISAFNPDAHYTYRKKLMVHGVLVPLVVDLWDDKGECTSVMVSVTTRRADGAYEMDVARFMWYFGAAATHGPRPAHLPLYLQQQLNEGGNDQASSLSPPGTTLASTSSSMYSKRSKDSSGSSRTSRAPSQGPRGRQGSWDANPLDSKSNRPVTSRSKSLGRKMLKGAKWMLYTPPGAGVPSHYTPKPYVEADPYSYDLSTPTLDEDFSASQLPYASAASDAAPRYSQITTVGPDGTSR